jgi:hypothetical protein
MQGKIRLWNRTRGFGFIEADSSSIFAHPKPATQDHCRKHSCKLRGDESCHAAGCNSGKRVGKRARNGNCGVSKGSRSRKPISRSDVEADGISNSIRSPCGIAQDSQHEAEGRNSLSQPLNQLCGSYALIILLWRAPSACQGWGSSAWPRCPR